MQPSKELSKTAYGRINATIKAYCSDSLEWLEILDDKTYDFIDSKYGSGCYEHYKDNQLYGHGMTLRYASNLPYWKPLKIVLPHGVNASKVVWSKSILANLPIACYSDHSLNVYRKSCLKIGLKSKLFLSLHPFSLLYDKLKKESILRDSTCRETLFFPSHSTKAISSGMHEDPQGLNKYMENLQQYGSLNLCIYYIDYLKLLKNNQWKQYKSYFNRVYCCGSRYDPAFLTNLLIIMSKHDSILSENVGSQIFYGAMADKHVELVGLGLNKNAYIFSDASKSNRTDNHERKKHNDYFIEMHKEIENSQADSKNLIQRYFLRGLTREEREEFKESIAYDCPDEEYGLSEKFNSKLYPFIM